eukprot:376401-Rhodomonas_salina.1
MMRWGGIIWALVLFLWLVRCLLSVSAPRFCAFLGRRGTLMRKYMAVALSLDLNRNSSGWRRTGWHMDRRCDRKFSSMFRKMSKSPIQSLMYCVGNEKDSVGKTNRATRAQSADAGLESGDQTRNVRLERARARARARGRATCQGVM